MGGALRALPTAASIVQKLLGTEGAVRLVCAWDTTLRQPAARASLARAVDGMLGTGAAETFSGPAAALSVAWESASLLVRLHGSLAAAAWTAAAAGISGNQVDQLHGSAVQQAARAQAPAMLAGEH